VRPSARPARPRQYDLALPIRPERSSPEATTNPMLT
jgi:hypothetical protein